MTFYENADGSVTTQVSSGRVNYQAADGSWHPIDTRLVAREDQSALSRPGGVSGDVRLESTANDLRVSLAGPAASKQAPDARTGDGEPGASADAQLGSWQELASVTGRAGEVIGYGLEGARPVLPTVRGSVATYRNVLPHTDIELTATATGLKEAIVLKSAEAGTSWVFPLRVEGLTPSLADDGSVRFANESGEVVWWIPPGWMSDSTFNPGSGEMTTSSAVTYELVKSEDGLALRVSADEAWIRHPDRTFPIRIDPTTQPYEPSGDVFVDNMDGGPPHNGDNLPVGLCTDPNGCGSYKARSFISFDWLTDIGWKIESASLYLHHTWSWDCTTHLPVTVRAVTSSWTVQNLTSLPASAYPGPTLGATLGTLTITDNTPACNNTGGDRSIGRWWGVELDESILNGWSTGGTTNYGLALTASESDTRSWKRFTSMDYAGGSLAPYIQLTYVENAPPQVTGYPGSGFSSPTLQPELAAAGTDDAWPGTPLTFKFHVYAGQPNAQGEFPELATSGNWSTSARWRVPSGVLSWGESYLWRVDVNDGLLQSSSAYHSLSTRVPQPPITGGLSQNSDGPGFSAVVGNYTTSAVDASVATVGPELQISRSYNSRDPRSDGAFGAGWSSLLDAQVRLDNATSPTLATVRYPNGQEATFARNPDGTWEPGAGRHTVLSEADGGYELLDKEGTRFRFGQSLGSGRFGLSSITDSVSRRLTLSYVNGRVETITSASGRSLYLTWSTAGRVESVRTDPADPADPTGSVSTWTYTYDGPRLSSVCPPETPTDCYTYTYDAGEAMSLHPTVVLDTQPRTYLRLGQASGTISNAAIDSLHVSTAVPTSAGTGAGPFPSSSAATFNGTSSVVRITGEDVPLAGHEQSISLWFKTPPGSTTGGVLFSTQNTLTSTTPTSYNPTLYVGTDGKLYGRLYTGNSSSMNSGVVVNDGEWHHVVLAATHATQELYVDGVKRKDTTDTQQPHPQHLGYVFVGTGRWSSRPATSGTYGYFNGSIAELALFNRPLTGDEVYALWTTGNTPSRPLTTVTSPSGKVAAGIDYDPVTGRVDSVVDANGGTWSIGDPTRSGSDLTYASAVLGAGPSNYWRLQQPNGSTAVNEINGLDATLSAVTVGVQGPFSGISPNAPTAASFNGTSSYVSTSTPAVDTTEPFTVSAWVKLSNNSHDHYVIAMPGTVMDGGAFRLYYREPENAWRVRMRDLMPDNSMGVQYADAPAGLGVTPGVWTHLAVSVNPDATSNHIVIYVNGEAVTRKTATIPFNNPTSRLLLGRSSMDVTATFLQGSLAEVATFRRVLSETEVAGLYRAWHASAGAPVKTVTVTDPMSASSSTVYDLLAGGRLIRSTDTRQETTVYGYDTGGFLRSVTDPNGNMVITGRDVRGNVVSRTTCQDQSANLCSTTYFTHYPNNEVRFPSPDPRNDVVLTVRDGRSSGPGDNTYVTTYTYDLAGNNTIVKDPLGRVTTTAYSDGTQVAAGGGLVPPGLPMRVVSPGGAVYRVEYYATGDPAAIVDTTGQRTEYRYDGLGRTVEEKVITDSHPGGLITTYTYDRNGRVTSSTAPSVVNRVTGATHTAKTTMWYNEDDLPIRTRIEDLTGGDAWRQTEQGFNALGQLEWVSDPQGNRTYYTYDARGNRVTQTPTDAGGTPLGPTVERSYDGEGHLLTTKVLDYYGSGNHLQWESRDYDPAGRLARVVDAMGWETRYTYTDNGQLATTTRVDTSANPDKTYVLESRTYDGAGHVTAVTTANGTLTTTFAVDAAGRTTSETADPSDVNRTTSYTFDRDDHVVSTVISDGSGASQRSDAIYDRAGNQLAQVSYPDGPATPVGRWELAETSGYVAADSAGNSPAGGGAVAWSTERSGSALFDGTTALATDGPVLDTTRPFTVAAWVKPDSAASGAMTAVSQDGERRPAFLLGHDSQRGFYVDVCDPNVFGGCWGVFAPGAAGTWTHLAAVYDGQSSLKLYVNGQLAPNAWTTMPRPGSGATGPLRIAGPAGAPAPTDSVTVTVPVLEDTMVAQANPDFVYGSSNQISARAPGSSPIESYLRFELPPAPTGMSLTGASLRLVTSNDPTAGSTGEHPISLLTAEWSEASTTWNTRPTTGFGAQLGVLSGATELNTPYPVELDAAQLAGLVGSEVSLALRSTSSDNVRLSSKESSTSSARPTLTLTYSPGPPPPPQPVTLSVAAHADTMVAEANPTNVYGASDQISARSPANSPIESYLRFALPDAPAGLTLTGVSLRVLTSSDPTAGSTGTHPISLLTGEWSEATTNWDNRPTDGFGPELGVLTGATDINTPYTVTLDPGPLVGLVGTEVSLALRSTSTDNVRLRSKDAAGNAANRPTLTLTYTPESQLTVQTRTNGQPSTEAHTPTRWTGGIDDVQVYQQALDAAQVSAIHAGNAPATGAQVIRTSARYDHRKLPVATTDPNGAVTWLAYDEAGRLAMSTSPTVTAEEHGSAAVAAPPVAMIGYNTFGEETEARDPKGRVVTTAYNASGQPVSQTMPSYTPPDGSATITGAQTTVDYDALGREWKITDPLGGVTERQYDLLDRVVMVETPDEEQTTYEYSLAGQLLAMVDPTGARTEATYDYLGRQLTVTQIVRQPTTAAHTTTYDYWPSGQLKTVTPPGRNPTTYHYNAVGESTSVIDQAGSTYQYTYDFAGRPVRSILPGGSGEKTVYDAAGRPIVSQKLAADGTTVLATTTVAYDRAGNTVAVTDPRGHTTELSYDAFGSLIELAEPVSATESITSSFGYDLAGAPTRFTNGRGHEFWTTYTTWGLPESIIEPSTTAHSNLADRTFTTAYDRAGRAVKELLPGGVSITTTYDAMGQVIAAAGAGAEVTTTTREFEYDPAGRPVEITGSGGANTLTWDDRGLLLSVTGPFGNSSYSYTADGLLASRVDAAGTTSYGYDMAARLSTIVNTGTGVNATLAYDVRSQVEKITYTDGSNSRQRSFGYDAQNRLSSDVVMEAPPSTVELGRIEYGYDAIGNITSKDTQGFAGSAENTYTYDWANRLTSWLEDTPSTTTLTEYAYDAAGNRTAVGERTFSYDERNRLTVDSDGNTYTYTARGTRATQVTPTSVTLQTHSDAFGQVLRQDAPGHQATYSYDGLGRLLQAGHAYTGLGNDLASDGTTAYTRDPMGNLIGAATVSVQRLVWTDHHTDVVGQFTPAGSSLAGSATYDPFGNILAASGLIGTLGYQSEYTDALTGRVNMHARWYNPDTGQFDNRDSLSVSPIPASVAANRYAYGYANPLGNTDPTGHDPGGGYRGGDCDAQCQVRAQEGAVSALESRLAAERAAANKSPWEFLREIGLALILDLIGWTSLQGCVTKGNVWDCVDLLSNLPIVKIAKIGVSLFKTADRLITGYKTWRRITDAAKTAVQTVTRQLNDARKLLDDLRRKVTPPRAPSPTPPRASAPPSAPKPSNPKPSTSKPNTPAAKPPATPKPAPAARPTDPPRSAPPPVQKSPSAKPPDSPSVPPTRQPDTPPRQPDSPTQGASCPIARPPVPMHSFDPATPVVMADGSTKRIDEIQIGDEVLATDPDTGDTTAQKVTALHRNEDTELTDVTVSPAPAGTVPTGEGEGDHTTRGPPVTVIKTTAHHPFWDATAQQWVSASDLRPGESTLTGPNGEIQYVTAVRNFTGAQHMRDLTVATIHTYYVMAGTTPVLVHNTGPTPGCGPGGVPRNPDGTYAPRNGEPGRDGSGHENLLWDLMEAEGPFPIIRGEIRVDVPGRPLRIYDGAIDLGDALIGIEGKIDGRPRSPQSVTDAIVNSGTPGTVRSGPHRGRSVIGTVLAQVFG